MMRTLDGRPHSAAFLVETAGRAVKLFPFDPHLVLARDWVERQVAQKLGAR